MNDRRALDRAHRAEVCRLNDGFEVRAGESRVDARDRMHADMLAAIHNAARVDAAFARSLRAQVNAWSPPAPTTTDTGDVRCWADDDLATHVLVHGEYGPLAQKEGPRG